MATLLPILLACTPARVLGRLRLGGSGTVLPPPAHTVGRKPLPLPLPLPGAPLVPAGEAALLGAPESPRLGVLVLLTSWPGSECLPAARRGGGGGGAAQSERLDHLYRKQCTAVAAPIGQFESDVHSPWLRQPPGGMAGPTSSAGSAAAGGPCASSYQLPPAAATAVGECLLAAALHLLALPAAPLGGDGERGCWPPVCCCCCSCGGLCWPPGLALAETVTETGM